MLFRSPPRVEYSLTELGQSFVPLLNQMLEWSQSRLCPGYENPYAGGAPLKGEGEEKP